MQVHWRLDTHEAEKSLRWEIMRASELHRINKATLNEQGDLADHFKEQADMLLKSAELPVPILEK